MGKLSFQVLVNLLGGSHGRGISEIGVCGGTELPGRFHKQRHVPVLVRRTRPFDDLEAR